MTSAARARSVRTCAGGCWTGPAAASRASAFSLPALADFAALRNRAFFLASSLIVAFCRRDLLSATRSSVVRLDSALVSVSLAARCLAAWPLAAADARTVLRSRRTSLDCDLIVCFCCHDLLSAARSCGPAMGLDSVFLSARSLATLAFMAAFPALAPSRARRSQKASSDSDRTRSD